MIPIPPLDGSKVLFALFPISNGKMIALEQYGFIFLLIFIMVFSGPLGYFLNFKVKYLPAPRKLTGDNAAMIGLAAYYHIQKKNIDSWHNIKVDSNMEL